MEKGVGDLKKNIRTTTITTRIETYHLTNELRYCIKTVNGKEKDRYLKYVGKKHYGYELIPIYKKDRSLLKKTNPFWLEDDKWFEGDKLPKPEKVDLKKVFYVQYSTHMFFDLNKKPLPVVYKGDYIEDCLSNEYYDLVPLRNYLKKHKKVISVSELLDIPYYNRDTEKSATKYIEVYVLANSNVQQIALDKSKKDFTSCKDIIFGTPYMNMKTDYLGIKKFNKRK